MKVEVLYILASLAPCAHLNTGIMKRVWALKLALDSIPHSAPHLCVHVHLLSFFKFNFCFYLLIGKEVNNQPAVVVNEAVKRCI